MSMDDVKGRTKEAAGALKGDDDLKREGRRDQAAGEAKDKLRGAEKWAEEQVDGLRERLERND